MNAEQITGINPYGKNDDMLRLSGNENTPYRLRDCVNLTGKYTFAVWCKASVESKLYLTVLGRQYEESIGTEWQRIKKTVEISDLSLNCIDIQITPGIDFYFYEAMLQEGEYDTAWKYAPEDVKGMTDAARTEAYDYTLQQMAELQISLDNITESVSETFVQLDNELQTLETWKNEASEKITADAIVHTVQESRIIDTVALQYAQTVEEQTSEKFSWIIKDGTNESNFTLTSRVASLLSAEFRISAITTFIDAAGSGSETVINGGAIISHSITADQLNVTDLFAVAAKIGAFTIQETSLYTGEKSEYASTADGVYIGADGIALGAGFAVNPQGVMRADSAELVGNIMIYNTSDTRKIMLGDTAFNFYIDSERIGTLSYDSCVLGTTDDAITKAIGFQLDDGIFTIGKGGYVTQKENRPYPEFSTYICNPGRTPIQRVDPDGKYCHIFNGPANFGGPVYIDNDLTVFSTFDVNVGTINASGHINASGTVTASEIQLTITNSDVFGNYIYGVKDDKKYSIVKIKEDGELWFGDTNNETRIYGSTISSNVSISVSSDRNKKNSIEPLDKRYLDLLLHLPPCRFQYKDEPNGGYHTGYIAQQLEEGMHACSISDDEFGALVRGADGMSIRYGEMTALNTLGIQYLHNMLAELTGEVQLLRTKDGGR